jgi:hypothetical protein
MDVASGEELFVEGLGGLSGDGESGLVVGVVDAEEGAVVLKGGGGVA